MCNSVPINFMAEPFVLRARVFCKHIDHFLQMRVRILPETAQTCLPYEVAFQNRPQRRKTADALCSASAVLIKLFLQKTVFVVFLMG